MLSLLSSILLGLFSSGSVPAIQPLNESLVDATIRVYATISSQLLPTPAKSHYTFSLRDLSKVFQGILMAQAGKMEVVRLKFNLNSFDVVTFDSHSVFTISTTVG